MPHLRCALFAFVACLAACKGSQSDAGGAPASSSSSPSSSAQAAQPSALAAATPAAAPKSPRLSKQECSQLVDHAMEVTMNEQLKGEKMTAAQRKQAMQEARKALMSSMKDFEKECNEMYTRKDFDCNMNATTEKALDACNSN